MKTKIFILPIALLSFTLVNAQLQTGNVLVGGDIAGISINLNKGGNFSANLNPKAAWFIRNNIAVGPYILLGISTAKGAGTNVNYGVGALGRYYFSRDEVNILRHARLFMEANAGIEGFNPAVGDNTNGLGLGVGPGLAYFITQNIGLEALVKYNGIVGFGTTPATNTINLAFGFQIYLPSRKIKDEIDRQHK